MTAYTETSHEVDHAVDGAAMAGVFELADIDELVVYAFKYRALAQQDGIGVGQRLGAHVLWVRMFLRSLVMR